MSRTYTRELAEHLSNLKFEDLPKNVTKKAKDLVLDFLGYAVAAADEPHARILLTTVEELGGKKESTILGYNHKTSCIHASLVNGSMGHMCELDDTHRSTYSHPGNPIISSGLAVAEREKANGKDFITAIVGAYESSLRIGESISPSHYEKGWCEPWLVFGSAAAAGRVLELDSNEMENALNLAGIQGAGVTGWFLKAQEYPVMAKDFRPGYLSADGVLSALLAKKGFTSHARFVENFGRLYSDQSVPSRITKALGLEFRIMEVAHKPYSACRFTHAAIDGVLKLKRKHVPSPKKTQKLKVVGNKHILGLNKPEPLNSLQSRFSVQFQVALALAEGKTGLNGILMDPTNYPQCKLDDPRIRKIMKETEVIHDSKLDKEKSAWSTIVEIGMGDGENFRARVDYPKGEVENPLKSGELHEKFRLVTSRAMEENKANEIIDAVTTLEKIEDISELASLFRTARQNNCKKK